MLGFGGLEIIVSVQGPSEVLTSGGMSTDKSVQMHMIKEVISRAVVIAAVAVVTTSAVRLTTNPNKFRSVHNKKNEPVSHSGLF